MSLNNSNIKKILKPVLVPSPTCKPYSNDLLPSKQKTLVQHIIGCLLYYARAIDSSILVASNKISQSQGTLTFHTLRLCYHLVDLKGTLRNTRVHFHASNILLCVDSDTVY